MGERIVMNVNQDILGGLIGFIFAFGLYVITLIIEMIRKSINKKDEKNAILASVIHDLELNKSKLSQLTTETESGIIPYYNLKPDTKLYDKVTDYLNLRDTIESDLDKQLREIRFEYFHIERKINAIWNILNGTAVEKQKYVARQEENVESGFSIMSIQNTNISKMLLTTLVPHTKATYDLVVSLINLINELIS